MKVTYSAVIICAKAMKISVAKRPYSTTVKPSSFFKRLIKMAHIPTPHLELVPELQRTPADRQRDSLVNPLESKNCHRNRECKKKVPPGFLNPALVPHCLYDLLPADLRLLTLP